MRSDVARAPDISPRRRPPPAQRRSGRRRARRAVRTVVIPSRHTVAGRSEDVRFGVLQFFSWTRRIPLTEVYERAFSRIDVMEQTGYDCVWLAEHHFSTYSVCPSINVMATH